MATHPLLSIITPAFNAAATIRTAAKSALNQSLSDIELLVIDDGSTDSTLEVLGAVAETDPRLRVIQQANAGASSARNAGIREARGSFVGFMDSDDAWLPGYADAVVSRLREQPGAGLAHADCLVFRDNDGRVYRASTLEGFGDVRPSYAGPELLAALIERNFITASSVTLTREALEAVEQFDPACDPCEDWDMWLRVAASGFGAVTAGAEPLVVLRESSTSISKDAGRMARASAHVVAGIANRLEEADPQKPRALARARELGEIARRVSRPNSLERGFDRAVDAARPFRHALLDGHRWKAPSPLQQALLGAAGVQRSRAGLSG